MKTVIQNLKTTGLVAAIGVAFVLGANDAKAQDIQTITVAGGCFWCVESDFETVPGVIEVVSGYTGGTTVNPTYKDVTREDTGHYEAVEIEYDRDVISEREIYDLFFRSIDPTDAGGQFCDRGDSYRTAIFINSIEQSLTAQAALSAAQAELGQSIVTQILDAGPFYLAEDYHQDYYKGENRVFTRAGFKTQAEAYQFYRSSCGRDARVTQLWGDDAPFVHHSNS